jgi:hypothetical protein
VQAFEEQNVIDSLVDKKSVKTTEIEEMTKQTKQRSYLNEIVEGLECCSCYD